LHRVCQLQKKEKEAEAAAQRELNDLFAVAIKQPKVPPGAVVFRQ